MFSLDAFEAALGAREVSKARQADHLRMLRQFDAFLGPRSLCEAGGEDLTAYLTQRSAAGYAPNTLRKERQMALSFFSWAYEKNYVSAGTLIGVRSTVSPPGGTSCIRPEPYSPKELRIFQEEIDARWPIMDDTGARKFVARWRKGVTPYSRIRKHAIRLQLDAVIALALHCGLRRREIFALHLDDIHYDNDYIVVWRGERWNSEAREVTFTDDARAAVAEWLDFRAGMGVEHDCPWLGLWAEKTARDPIKPDAFAKLLSGYAAPGLSYRRLRHTCGIGWLKAGMTLWEVQRLLGLATLKDALPYGEIMEAKLDQRVDRLQSSFSDAVASAA